MKQYHKTLIKSALAADVFMKKTFNNVFVEGHPLCQKATRDSPTMIVCSHRSHLDYILLGIELNRLGLINLRFAAGDNLTKMPYVGKKFRSLGAFPVHRDRVMSRKYIFQLCDEVVAMLNAGDNIIVFPEGGRSYGGGMMEIKSGIVAANIFAQFKSPGRTYLYLPITISYEILPELMFFNLLEKGRKLRKVKSGLFRKMTGNLYYYGADIIAFAKFIVAHKFGVNYGSVYIDYGEPFAIHDFIDIIKHYNAKMRNEFSAHKTAIKIAEEEIYKRLTHLYRILPMHVISYLLQNGSNQQIELTAKIPDVVTLLKKQNKNCKSLNILSEREIFEQGTDQLRHLNAITLQNNTISIRKNDIINYYAQSV